MPLTIGLGPSQFAQKSCSKVLEYPFKHKYCSYKNNKNYEFKKGVGIDHCNKK